MIEYREWLEKNHFREAIKGDGWSILSDDKPVNGKYLAVGIRFDGNLNEEMARAERFYKHKPLRKHSSLYRYCQTGIDKKNKYGGA